MSKMVIVIETKLNNGKDFKCRYDHVIRFEVMPKECVKSEIDDTTYQEMPDFVFRMYFNDGSGQCTWSYTKDFKFKVLFHTTDSHSD